MIVEVMPLMRPLIGLNTGRRNDVRPFLRLGTLERSPEASRFSVPRQTCHACWHRGRNREELSVTRRGEDGEKTTCELRY